MNESRICIALDFKTKSDVENFLKQFEGESLYVKVGMELFYGEGIEIIKMIKEMGHKIFSKYCKKCHETTCYIRCRYSQCSCFRWY